MAWDRKGLCRCRIDHGTHWMNHRYWAGSPHWQDIDDAGWPAIHTRHHSPTETARRTPATTTCGTAPWSRPDCPGEDRLTPAGAPPVRSTLVRAGVLAAVAALVALAPVVRRLDLGRDSALVAHLVAVGTRPGAYTGKLLGVPTRRSPTVGA